MAMKGLPTVRRTHPGFRLGYTMSCTNSSSRSKDNRLAKLKSSELRLQENAESYKVEIFEKDCQALRPRLLRIALRITRNPEDAEDAVQNALMKAYLHIDDFQQNSAFSTWLTRIVMNSALTINRRNRTARRVSAESLNASGAPVLRLQIPDHSPNPEQTCVERERTRILQEAIRKLRPR